MMFFKSLAAAACLLLSVSAQSIQIGSPQPGDLIHPGKNFTIEVDRPNSLTGSQEVALVIAMQNCDKTNCTQFTSTEYLQHVLYFGSYNPQYQSGPGQGKPPHQNFSVVVPLGFGQGKSRISVTHLSLVGASPFALYETRNVTVTVG